MPHPLRTTSTGHTQAAAHPGPATMKATTSSSSSLAGTPSSTSGAPTPALHAAPDE